MYNAERHQLNRERENASHRKWYNANKEKRLTRIHEYQKEAAVHISVQKVEENRAAKIECLTHYGKGKLACVRCGYDKIDALSLDHINGGGHEQRKITGTGVNLYKWLKRRNYPEGYQTLCMCCQHIKKVQNHEQIGGETPQTYDYNSWQYRYNQTIREECLTYYGNGKCACVKCGYDNIDGLSVDHINGGGKQHQRERGTSSLMLWLRKNNFPEGYQTLCMNDQFIKRAENREHNSVKAPKYQEKQERSPAAT
jgi:hypothetical protein